VMLLLGIISVPGGCPGLEDGILGCRLWRL